MLLIEKSVPKGTRTRARKTEEASPPSTREQPEHDQRDKKEGDRLYDVLAALPFEQRIEAIEAMAERMGV
jgi:hypothetical protein